MWRSFSTWQMFSWRYVSTWYIKRKIMSCGEMWSKICHVETFLHMINVETIFFVTIHADLSQNLLCCHLRCIGAKSILSRFTHFCVEKNLFRNCACGEKRTNIRYVDVTSVTLSPSNSINAIDVTRYYWMLNITKFQCSNVPIFQWWSVSMFQCSNVPMFQYSIDPLVHWSIGPFFHWSIGPMVHWGYLGDILGVSWDILGVSLGYLGDIFIIYLGDIFGIS